MRVQSMSLDLERHDLGDAQSGAVGRAQRGLVLRTRRRLEQSRDLLGTQHQRQFARLADERETAGEIGPVQRHGEEEAQRRDGAVDAWGLAGPLWVWCNWNRRRSSAVALSGERPRKAAKVFT